MSVSIFSTRPRRTLAVFIALALGAGTAHAAKVHPGLTQLADQARTKASLAPPALRSAGIAKARTATVRSVRMQKPIKVAPGQFAPTPLGADGRIGIVAIAQGDAKAAVADLKRLGATQVAVTGKLINARLPANAVASLAPLTSIREVGALPSTNLVMSGAATSGGDAAIRANLARAGLSANGRGVKVCVDSDSYDTLPAQAGRPKAAQDVASGDLPGPGNPFGFTTPVQVIQEGPARSDEGRAMAQIVHDVAPGATLAFGSFFAGGQATHVDLLEKFATNGCNVVVDDTFTLNGPWLRDGIVAQKIDNLVGRGIHYFISAGNYASNGFTTPYRAGGTFEVKNFGDGASLGQYELLNFNPDPNGAPDFFQKITPTGNLDLALQWADRHLTEGQAGGAQGDLDVFLTSSPSLDSVLFASSGRDGAAPNVYFQTTDSNGQPLYIVSAQNGSNVGGDPLERFVTLFFDAQFNLIGSQVGVPNLGIDLYLVVARRANGAPSPGHVRWLDLSRSLSSIEYLTTANSQTSVGAQQASRAVSVAAASYNTINLANAASPATVEGFSSRGGAPLYYDTAGRPLATPIVRRKPEVTGPDGVDTTFFVGGPNIENNAFPNFNGTSASAPHLAGVAAILLSATGKQPTPDTLRAFLQATAKDMDDPQVAGFQTGFDARTGSGIVDAFEAGAAITTDVSSLGYTFPAGALLGNGRPYQLIAGSSIANVTASGYGTGTTSRREENARYSVDPAPVTISNLIPDRLTFMNATGRSTDGNTSAFASINAYVTNLGFLAPTAATALRANQAFTLQVAAHEAVTKVEYVVGSTVIASSTDAGGNFRASAKLGAGAQTITARASNAAGTLLYTRAITVTVAP